jgi:hypothetical protein
VFVPGKPFQYSLIFVGKACALPSSGANERHYGRLLALSIYIRLGWKSLSGTNNRSLLGQLVSFKYNKVIRIWPQALWLL